MRFFRGSITSLLCDFDHGRVEADVVGHVTLILQLRCRRWERLRVSCGETSAALLVSKQSWQRSGAVTLRGGPVTSFHESKGTFLEAPCKAFWFAPCEAHHQGNSLVNNKSDVLYILRAASGTKKDKKRLALTVQAAFFSHVAQKQLVKDRIMR